MREEMKDSLSLENQSYWQAVKRNPRAKYFLSPYVKYYEETKDGGLIVGNGVERRILDYTKRNSIELEVIDNRAVRSAQFQSTIKLRDYQEGIPEDCARAGGGIIKLSTGFGKTIVALKLVELLQVKTLIVVPKLDLLKQFADSYEQYFGEQPGIIQGNKFEIKSCTIATAQTLGRRIDSNLFTGSEFGCVIADECHLYVPEKTRRSVDYFRSKYRYGLSATPERTDGHGEAIRFIFGDIIVDKALPQESPIVHFVDYAGYIAMGEYYQIIERQVEDVRRNKLIVDNIIKAYGRGRTTLVLTKRISHYEHLMLLLRENREDVRCIALASNATKSERERVMGELRGQHPYNVIFGTYSLLSTGVDIPKLDTLVVAGDLKSSVLARQSVGRILRLFDDKKEPLIIDIQDTNNYVLKKQAKERRKFYEANGWTITSQSDWVANPPSSRTII